MNALQQGLMTVFMPLLGRLCDLSHCKRLLAASGGMSMMLSVAVTVFLPQYFVLQFLNQVPLAYGFAMMMVSMGALTLGTMEPENFSQQVSLNNVGLQTGFVVGAISMGLFSFFGPEDTLEDGSTAKSAAWSAVPLSFAFVLIAATQLIRPETIDHVRAAGGKAEGKAGHDPKTDVEARGTEVAPVYSKRVLWQLMLLSFTFNLANMAVMQLIVQRGAGMMPDLAIPFCCVAICVGNGSMLVCCALGGKVVDKWGRKPLLLISCGNIGIRALLCALNDSYWVSRGGSPWAFLVPIQVMDGIGAGLWGMLLTIVTEDITRGGGGFNVTFGCAQGMFTLGAVASSAAGGYFASACGFSAAFAVLGFVGLTVFVQMLLFPETMHAEEPSTKSDDTVPLVR